VGRWRWPEVGAATSRDPDGRLFNPVTPEDCHFLLEKVGFRLLTGWDSEDSLGRRRSSSVKVSAHEAWKRSR
jgi:hypothetical protein